MSLSDITPDQAAELMRAAFGELDQKSEAITVEFGLIIRADRVNLWLENTGVMLAFDDNPKDENPKAFNAVAVVDLLRSWGVKLESE